MTLIISKRKNDWKKCKEFAQNLQVRCAELAILTTLLTVASVTYDWDVFTVTAVMNAPPTMSALSQRPLIASTLDVVQPDWTWTSAVVVAQVHTGSSTHTFITDISWNFVITVNMLVRNSAATFWVFMTECQHWLKCKIEGGVTVHTCTSLGPCPWSCVFPWH